MKTTFLRIFIMTFLGAILLVSCQKSYNYPAATGKAGSMARFTIAGDFLYVIDNRNLKVFNILQADSPAFITEMLVGPDIETVFPHNNMLFIGSRTGMYIYNITVPSQPVFLAEVSHFISCDPVVVNDSLAYVTLRSGGDCRTSANVNQLEIYNISSPASPQLRMVFPMESPHGLGLNGNILYVCHGEGGFGVYDVSNTDSISELSRVTGLHAWDVIPNGDILLVVGETGFYQYNCAQPDSLYLLSQIVKGE